MRIWHGLVAVLAVALIMPIVRAGLGGLLVVDAVVFFYLFIVGRTWWHQPRPVRARYRPPDALFLDVVAMVLICTFTGALVFCNVLVILHAIGIPNVPSLQALFHR